MQKMVCSSLCLFSLQRCRVGFEPSPIQLVYCSSFFLHLVRAQVVTRNVICVDDLTYCTAPLNETIEQDEEASWWLCPVFYLRPLSSPCTTQVAQL
ncbi:hypothetical protein F5Y18DRAFT_18042 [Xylariaceae sp. FL1019]|nr:hypothetical protein F5Y18DRAFT_18042 [Xylariaceae sp. FL1019]